MTVLSDGNATSVRTSTSRPTRSLRQRTSVAAAIAYLLAAICSVLSVALAANGRLPLDLTEVIGFVTGAWTVWLTVRENIWNWPIGIVNNVAFGILFVHTGLYADASLQGVYLVISAFGWYWWLHGGSAGSRLVIAHIAKRQWPLMVLATAATTVFMTVVLRAIHDTAPFLDALTTALSLLAQYMLTRKYIENWWVWMSADVIYVGLYASKGLGLTAVLYGGFFGLCVVGLRAWRRSNTALVSTGTPHA